MKKEAPDIFQKVLNTWTSLIITMDNEYEDIQIYIDYRQCNKLIKADSDPLTKIMTIGNNSAMFTPLKHAKGKRIKFRTNTTANLLWNTWMISQYTQKNCP